MTLSPTPLSPTQTIQFERGHAAQTHPRPEHIKIGDAWYLGIPKAKARYQLVEAIFGLLQQPEGICLLENSLADACDGWLQRAKSKIVTNGDEVYHVLFNTDRDKHKIEAAIREWDKPPTSIGAFGSMNEKAAAQIASAQSLTREQLAAFGKSAQSVFVRAYDGEGYIQWNR